MTSNDPVVASSKLGLDVLAAKVVARMLAFGHIRHDSQILGRTLIAGHDRNEFALTYDDGPNVRSTAELLNVLARYNVRATFFLIGRWVQHSPEIVRDLQSAGHLIGNHTMTHPYLANKPLSLIESEIRDCNSTLEDVLGQPVRYFRAPHGGLRPAVLRAVRRMNLVPVQWNLDAMDYKAIGADTILNNIEGAAEPIRKNGRSANILLHDGLNTAIDCDRSETVRATDLFLQKMRDCGRCAVTVDAWE